MGSLHLEAMASLALRAAVDRDQAKAVVEIVLLDQLGFDQIVYFT